MDSTQIEKCLVDNESLFNHLYVVEQQFDIIPNSNHYGMAITYVDLQERRVAFLEELINTIVDWVYSKNQQNRIISDLALENRSPANSYSKLLQLAHGKFRKTDSRNLLHGQFGELLLSNCIQRFMRAAPILRKMPITTSPNFERFGADAIHYKCEGVNNLIYLGEAKSYTSKYQFNTAFNDALTSIVDAYNNIQSELKHYIYDDFLDEDLRDVAQQYLNSTLPNVKVNLVSMISYNETQAVSGSCENEKKACIDEIIKKRYSDFDNNIINMHQNAILDRITYIVFPIWEFDSLLDEFAGCIWK